MSAKRSAGEVEALINGVISGDPVTVAKAGRPVAVVIAYDSYQELLKELKFGAEFPVFTSIEESTK